MVRIICDIYEKGEKHIWDLDKDNPNNQAFNRKILAVNEMYGWLYEKGILRDVSFEFKDYSNVCYFALDVKTLEPYRQEMAAAGLLDGDVALRHIFEENYTPCEYSGAIELGWTMMGYRDFDGTVSRSWECGLVKGLSACAVLDVQEIKEREGVQAAVKAAFAFAGFYPSDITKNGQLMAVRPLQETDRDTIEIFDEMVGNHLSDMLEDNEDYAWGLFVGEKLVGCCSIGYADEFIDDGEGNGYPKCTADSLLVGDVFVLPEFRGQGCGSYMVDKAVRLCTEKNPQRVFLSVMDDSLCEFYGKIGFSSVADGVMMRDARDLNEVKREEAFERAFAHFSENDEDMAENRDYLLSHAEKLIFCFEMGENLDMMGVDFWAQYEELLGEQLDYYEYRAVDSVLDGDPYDIEEDDVEKIEFLREALVGFRNEGYEWEPKTILSLIEDAVLRASDLQPVDSLEGEDLEYDDENADLERMDKEDDFEYGLW